MRDVEIHLALCVPDQQDAPHPACGLKGVGGLGWVGAGWATPLGAPPGGLEGGARADHSLSMGPNCSWEVEDTG